VRVYEAAQKKRPDPVKPFVITIARNLVIDRMRRERIVSIEAVADLAELEIAEDRPGPERNAIARQEFRQLQIALEHLSPRCREAVVLKKIEGLTIREIAVRMGIGVDTVNEYLAIGMVNLANRLPNNSGNEGGSS
jgi:RNA polymerase sigma-70 factor (ECF subfamily)